MSLYVKEKSNVSYMVTHSFSFGLRVTNTFGCDRHYRDYINYIYIYVNIFMFILIKNLSNIKFLILKLLVNISTHDCFHIYFT